MADVDSVKAWTQIEGWLAEHMSSAVGKLPSGVKAESLAGAQDQLGFEIPAELAAFLGVHDGSGDMVLHDWGAFMSLDQILNDWDMLVDLWGEGDNDEYAEPPAQVKKKWFSPKWVPFVRCGTGDLLCLDLDPTKKGKVGQVIVWMNSGGPEKVLAPSLGGFLADYIEELKKGKYEAATNQAGGPYLAYQH